MVNTLMVNTHLVIKFQYLLLDVSHYIFQSQNFDLLYVYIFSNVKMSSLKPYLKSSRNINTTNEVDYILSLTFTDERIIKIFLSSL